ncbi:MAG: MaoC family dehydratase N-terminal domain-containing protein [Chloroflexota bacterium]|nr:MaoC family dehydratase N-terminal domain-containing protein [Chloroflexota bacterium]
MTTDKTVHPRLSVAGQGVASLEHEEYTPEKEQRRRFRANKPYYPKTYYFNTQASRDGIRHFAEGMGDTNPLFSNVEYAKNSRYGSIISPPCFLYTIQWVPPGSGAAGIHGWYVGGDWEWYSPIHEGDEFTNVVILRDLVKKEGKMGGGRTWIDYTEVIYINQRNEIVGKELQHTVWGERARTGQAGKYRGVDKPVYTQEDWAKILKLYEKEEVRGAEPRYWEDVRVGDKVGPMVKGPLSVRDEIAWLMGAGSPFFRAHGIEYAYEHRHPKALEYVEETGDADVPELVHIFDAFARTIGVERAYDYGCQRMSWLSQLFTNWIGDDGFLWRMSGDERVFNQMADITTFEGKVVRKYIENRMYCVDIEAWAKNQRDELSMPPHISTVVLPSRERGPITYPSCPSKLVEEVKKARPLEDLIKEGLI